MANQLRPIRVPGAFDVGTGEVICNFTSYVVTGRIASGVGSGTYTSTIQSSHGNWATATCSFQVARGRHGRVGPTGT